MAGVDVCQKLSGVTLKLLAFERLLTEYPNHRDEVRNQSAAVRIVLEVVVWPHPSHGEDVQHVDCR